MSRLAVASSRWLQASRSRTARCSAVRSATALRRRGDLRPRPPGGVARLLHLELGVLDLAGDPLVLAADVVQELELVEQVREARRLEHDGQRRGRIGGVDLDDPLVQPLRRRLVLALQEDELAGLEPVELVQAVEPALVEREHALELVEAG